jgi:hypothetical protein
MVYIYHATNKKMPKTEPETISLYHFLTGPTPPPAPRVRLLPEGCVETVFLHHN